MEKEAEQKGPLHAIILLRLVRAMLCYESPASVLGLISSPKTTNPPFKSREKGIMILTVQIHNFKMNMFTKYIPSVDGTISIISVCYALERTLALKLDLSLIHI